MPAIQYSSNDVSLLARLMRAEAEGDGQLGMLMVGNVGVNRVLGNCLDFRGITNIRQMVFQSPGGFEATQRGYFYQAARSQDKRLARRTLAGERFNPATNSLWFFQPPGDCPAQWYDQWNTGRFKAHCFFAPSETVCPDVY
ncbi:MAG: cell wall hydrolase [Sporolactobacillus sp.]|jgi:N-acetylmuramoyl-L-alanine amidase|nr:cell wall hydrolase [Sporolactobacillus sp.]